MPLGVPVVPEVKAIRQMSSAAVGMFLVGGMTQFLYWRMLARRSVWSTVLYAYWYVNLMIALYGDFIGNSFTWVLPICIYCIDAAARWSSRLQLRHQAGARIRAPAAT